MLEIVKFNLTYSKEKILFVVLAKKFMQKFFFCFSIQNEEEERMMDVDYNNNNDDDEDENNGYDTMMAMEID